MKTTFEREQKTFHFKKDKKVLKKKKQKDYFDLKTDTMS